MKISKEELLKLYVDEKRSIYEINNITNININTLYWYMNKYSIKRRSKSEAGGLSWDMGRSTLTKKMVEASTINVAKARKNITPDSRKKQSESLMKRYDEGLKPWNFREGYQNKLNRRVRTSRWFKLSQEIKKRDNFTCRKCGKIKKTLQCHHIDGDDENNNHDNLITLCNSCHMKASWKLGQIKKF